MPATERGTQGLASAITCTATTRTRSIPWSWIKRVRLSASCAVGTTKVFISAPSKASTCSSIDGSGWNVSAKGRAARSVPSLLRFRAPWTNSPLGFAAVPAMTADENARNAIFLVRQKAAPLNRTIARKSLHTRVDTAASSEAACTRVAVSAASRSTSSMRVFRASRSTTAIVSFSFSSAWRVRHSVSRSSAYWLWLCKSTRRSPSSVRFCKRIDRSFCFLETWDWCCRTGFLNR